MKRIYVCSPLKMYGLNTPSENINKAERYCRFVAVEEGEAPIAPHVYCTRFLDDEDGDERELGMYIGISLLDSCDELWVFGSYISDGMAKEIQYAVNTLRIPVKFFTRKCERRP